MYPTIINYYLSPEGQDSLDYNCDSDHSCLSVNFVLENYGNQSVDIAINFEEGTYVVNSNTSRSSEILDFETDYIYSGNLSVTLISDINASGDVALFYVYSGTYHFQSIIFDLSNSNVTGVVFTSEEGNFSIFLLNIQIITDVAHSFQYFLYTNGSKLSHDFSIINLTINTNNSFSIVEYSSYQQNSYQFNLVYSNFTNIRFFPSDDVITLATTTKKTSIRHLLSSNSNSNNDNMKTVFDKFRSVIHLNGNSEQRTSNFSLNQISFQNIYGVTSAVYLQLQATTVSINSTVFYNITALYTPASSFTSKNKEEEEEKEKEKDTSDGLHYGVAIHFERSDLFIYTSLISVNYSSFSNCISVPIAGSAVYSNTVLVSFYFSSFSSNFASNTTGNDLYIDSDGQLTFLTIVSSCSNSYHPKITTLTTHGLVPSPDDGLLPPCTICGNLRADETCVRDRPDCILLEAGGSSENPIPSVCATVSGLQCVEIVSSSQCTNPVGETSLRCQWNNEEKICEEYSGEKKSEKSTLTTLEISLVILAGVLVLLAIIIIIILIVMVVMKKKSGNYQVLSTTNTITSNGYEPSI